MKTWRRCLGIFTVVGMLTIAVVCGVFTIHQPTVSSQAMYVSPSLELERAMRITEYCVTLARYADAVAVERAGRVPRQVLLAHVADTSLAYLNQRGQADATAVINTIYDNPTLPVRMAEWATCHAAMRGKE